MAETAATSNPRARRTPAKKAAPAVKPAAKAPAKTEGTAGEPVKIELEYTADTTRYAKFQVPTEYKGTITGAIYPPHGTARVVIAVFPEEPAASE